MYKQVGDAVAAGEVLALVDAAEVGRAKSEFLQALAEARLKTKNYQGLARAAASGAMPSAGCGKAKRPSAKPAFD